MPSERAIATFFTTHAALRAEKAVKEARIEACLVPTPRDLSVDCTVALAFPASEQERVRSILDAQRIEVSGLHRLTL